MRVKVYSTERCPYCIKAKEWLSGNSIKFEEIILDNQDAISQFREDCPGLTSVPQILIDGVLHSGGYDGLMEHADAVKETLCG